MDTSSTHSAQAQCTQVVFPSFERQNLPCLKTWSKSVTSCARTLEWRHRLRAEPYLKGGTERNQQREQPEDGLDSHETENHQNMQAERPHAVVCFTQVHRSAVRRLCVGFCGSRIPRLYVQPFASGLNLVWRHSSVFGSKQGCVCGCISLCNTWVLYLCMHAPFDPRSPGNMTSRH